MLYMGWDGEDEGMVVVVGWIDGWREGEDGIWGCNMTRQTRQTDR